MFKTWFGAGRSSAEFRIHGYVLEFKVCQTLWGVGEVHTCAVRNN